MTKLKVARSLPNDQNGLLDHLALISSKSSLCQLQLCIKVVLFQKQKIKDAKSQCTHLGIVSACCKADHASYKHNLDAGGKAAQTGPGRKSTIAKIYEITLFFLTNFGLLMHVDALSYRIVDFSLVFIMFAARRKTIMQEFSPVQKCVLFLVFLNMSGRDSA